MGYDTYDYLPDEGAAYPFVFLGEQSDQDIPNKSAVFGAVQQTLHVYHNDYRKRGSTTDIVCAIKTELRKIDRTANFYWRVTNMSGQVLTDNTTATPLLHGIIQVEFEFN